MDLGRKNGVRKDEVANDLAKANRDPFRDASNEEGTSDNERYSRTFPVRVYRNRERGDAWLASMDYKNFPFLQFGHRYRMSIRSSVRNTTSNHCVGRDASEISLGVHRSGLQQYI